MVLALQIVLAVCFVGIAVDMFIDINKNHKGECKMPEQRNGRRECS